ncbi:MAG: hypothetical protein CML73_02865 [Rhodobiaceae bacterium]|nr:hypothetical protein [Rhodobiaceae bacterium]
MAMQRVDRLDVTSSELKDNFLPGMPDAYVRECCREEKTGGQHFVIEMKQGFTVAAGYNSASMDIYVLEGAFMIGDDNLSVGCYTYIPGGMNCGDWHSENGARVLFFTNKAFEYFPGQEGEIDMEAGDHIPVMESWKLSWADPMKDIVKKSTWVNPDGEQDRPPGVLTKALRKDDRTGEVIALTALSPGFIDPGTEHHPHNECLYLISGDAYIGYTYDHERKDIKEDLVLKKDHYIGRPPGIRHGPVCTQSGALWLIYLSDMYTGLYTDVADWETRVGGYLAAANYR